VTASWQKNLAEQDDVSSVGEDIQLFAFLCVACGVGVAASPMGNIVGTILHMALAGGFAAFGINYCIRAQTLASDRGDTVVATIRNVCWIAASGGGAIMVFGIYPAGVGTEKLQRHENGQEEMSPSEIYAARRNELVLAIGQVSVGVMIGIALITAAAEVGEVEDDDNALVIGLVSAAIALVVSGTAYVLNNTFYNMCQSGKYHDCEEEKEQNEEET
jgi:hypothetical protein